MTISLQGQTVVVTGGARRLGRAIALECARARADVAITYRTSAQEAAQTVRDLEAINPRGRFSSFALDVTSNSEVAGLVKRVEDELGGATGSGQQRGDFRAHSVWPRWTNPTSTRTSMPTSKAPFC